MYRKAGVTVAEVIIVLILVAVIAAVLFPVFAKSRDGRRQASCPSNLKQIELGIIQYVQDYDEFYPPRQARIDANGKVVSWRAIINSYVKSTQIYQCPDNPVAKWPDIEKDGFNRSYAANSTTVAKLGASGPFSDAYGGKLQIAEIASPASVISLAESTAAFNDMNLTFPDGFTHKFHAGNPVGALYAGHTGGSNYGFVDGHVKYLHPSDTLNQNVNMWTRDNSNFSDTENSQALAVLQFPADQEKGGQR
ncbi:MAG: prepilin-type N-terminal cleavage/methylation domain [Capsulimonas sp.]|jgi:prepilin-type processing-associated H-X9-DG protein|nr:prepilin-type N-terminal cleavage/methylation domain [Capsulimonas sp.]